MTGFGRAEAQQVVAAQFIERAQQMVLIAQPPFRRDEDGCAIAVDADPKRIAPFAAASDVDSIGVVSARVLVENLAHMNPPIHPLPCFPRSAAGDEAGQQAGGAKGAKRNRSHAQGARGRAWRGPTLSAAAGARPKTAGTPRGDVGGAMGRSCRWGPPKIDWGRTLAVDNSRSGLLGADWITLVQGVRDACPAQAASSGLSMNFAVLRRFLLLSARSASMRVSSARLASSSAWRGNTSPSRAS